MRKILFVLPLFIASTAFCQDEITHITKVYSNGTPKEVIVYKRVSEDLKSDNPFQIVEKITYNTKGEYIGPRVTSSDLRNAKNWIVGSWNITLLDSEIEIFEIETGIITFDKNGYVTEGDTGSYSIIQKNDKIVMEWLDHGGTYYYPITFNNRNEFIVDIGRAQITAKRVK